MSKMGSSWAFKITASFIKPTRESLLDYCSYILVIISLISFARVIIGKEELRQNCHVAELRYSWNKTIADVLVENSVNYSLYNKNKPFSPLEQQRNEGLQRGEHHKDTLKIHKNFILSSDLKPHVSSKVKSDSDYIISSQQGTANNNGTVCFKFYQTYFTYFLLIESLILLLVGIIWVKIPKVQSIVTEFGELLNLCEKALWLSRIVDKVYSHSTTTFAQSLYSIFRSNEVNMEVHVLLSTLFKTNASYNSKSQARCLYEKIQRFCQENETSQTVWYSYIKKSVYQFILWLLFFSVNMALFVKMEFYIGCNPSDKYCDHDTFLRIIWFMTQLVMLIYGIFNCSTLKWINDKSVPQQMKSSSWFLFIGCFTHASPCSHFGNQYTCRPFRIEKNQRIVYNDVALLLHLVNETQCKKLPYFTFFLFHQWEETFRNAGDENPVSISRDFKYFNSRPDDLHPETEINAFNHSHTTQNIYNNHTSTLLDLSQQIANTV